MSTVEYLNYEVLDDRGWNVDDDDLFEKAAEAELPEEDYGTFEIPDDEFVLRHAEENGHDWPFSCRTGMCTNCAVVLKEGEIAMAGQRVLGEDEIEEAGIRLTCIGKPATETVKLIYNAKHMDRLRDRVAGGF